MARFDIPKGDSNDVAPISARRIKRATLDRIKAFITEQDVKDNDGKVTGTRMSPKLAFYWNSGHIQRNAEGDPVYSEDGNEQTHYIVDGFVTISQHYKGNLPSAVLPALGFEGPDYYDDEGNLLNEGDYPPFDMEFGENALGEDYSDITDLLNLPLYDRNNKNRRKGQVECEVTSLKVHGYELLGRSVELELFIDNGWNRIRNYMLPEDFESLEDEGERAEAWLADLHGTSRKKAKTKTKGKAKSDSAAEPMDDGKQAKGQRIVAGWLEEAGIERDSWPATLGQMLGHSNYTPLNKLTFDECRTIKEMVNDGQDLSVMQAAFDEAGQFPPEEDLPW